MKGPIMIEIVTNLFIGDQSDYENNVAENYIFNWTSFWVGLTKF